MMKAGKNRLLIKDVKEVEAKKQNDWTPVEKLEISMGIVVDSNKDEEIQEAMKVYFVKGTPIKVGDDLWVIRTNEILAYGE